MYGNLALKYFLVDWKHVTRALYTCNWLIKVFTWESETSPIMDLYAFDGITHMWILEFESLLKMMMNFMGRLTYKIQNQNLSFPSRQLRYLLRVRWLSSHNFNLFYCTKQVGKILLFFYVPEVHPLSSNQWPFWCWKAHYSSQCRRRNVDLLIKCLPVLSKLCTEVHLEDSLLPQCKKLCNSQRHNAGQIKAGYRECIARKENSGGKSCLALRERRCTVKPKLTTCESIF